MNWFRRDENGKFIWPGFGENMRVLKWIVERVEGKAGAKDTPIGFVPRYEDLDWQGLDFSRETFEKLTDVDRGAWREEVKDHARLFEQLKSRHAGRARGKARGAGARAVAAAVEPQHETGHPRVARFVYDSSHHVPLRTRSLSGPGLGVTPAPENERRAIAATRSAARGR